MCQKETQSGEWRIYFQQNVSLIALGLCETVRPDEYTYAAPATNISTVLALVKPDNVAIKRIVEITITTIRSVTLLNALQMITGTNKKTTTSNAINVRAVYFINEPENTYTFESLELSRQRLYFLI